ncbi:hypothetical protein OHB14_45205 [Streptomyces sp. NBC_01613]|uniref:phage terminase large subunit family protein n=1 Tax=Streptomyces sp. NBC_01613 TaxID=2975896 RepID=UPI0038680C6C
MQNRPPTRRRRRCAAALHHEHQADYVVIEVNNGGDYLPALLAEVDPTVPCRIVHATRGKRARAAPMAMLYEQSQSRISHAGPPRTFAVLEQMTTYVGASEAEEKSPHLLDSCVWALTDLFLDAGGATSPGHAAERPSHRPTLKLPKPQNSSEAEPDYSSIGRYARAWSTTSSAVKGGSE